MYGMAGALRCRVVKRGKPKDFALHSFPCPLALSIPMKPNQVAAQLYTCRNSLTTSAGIAETLKRLRAVGYRAVQASGLAPIPARELRAILDGEGVVCCATHERGADILERPEKVAERLDELGCEVTAYPYPDGVDFGSSESVQKLAQGLNRSGKVLSDAGKILCYHNHNHEFRKLNGKTILETIYEATSPGTLQAELDTYWVQYGGGDVVEWCEKMKGRMPIIHLKDYMTNGENRHQMCEIGSGNLNFKRIVAAAEMAGCRWFAVEQDECPGDPVDSLAQSFEYIAENLLG